MRALIIGGAGFLGSRLAESLSSEGHEVAVYDNFSGSYKHKLSKKYRIFGPSAADENTMLYTMSVYKPEIVIVSLAYSAPKDVVYKFSAESRLILESTASLLAALNPGVKHLYYCSSSEVYGPPARGKLKESSKISTCSTNQGVACLSAEMLLGSRCAEIGVPLTILRIFDMYGPRDFVNARSDVAGFIIEGMLRGPSAGELGLSYPTQLRDFVHVDDVVSAFMGIIRSGYSGVVNIGTGTGVCLRDLSSALIPLIPGSVTPREMPPRKKVINQVADTGVLRSLVPGWRPAKHIIGSLPELIEYRQQALLFESRYDPRAVLKSLREG